MTKNNKINNNNSSSSNSFMIIHRACLLDKILLIIIISSSSQWWENSFIFKNFNKWPNSKFRVNIIVILREIIREIIIIMLDNSQEKYHLKDENKKIKCLHFLFCIFIFLTKMRNKKKTKKIIKFILLFVLFERKKLIKSEFTHWSSFNLFFFFL